MSDHSTSTSQPHSGTELTTLATTAADIVSRDSSSGRPKKVPASTDEFDNVLFIDSTIHAKSQKEGIEHGREEGMKEGYSKGLESGRNVGFEVGLYAGCAEMALRKLEANGGVSTSREARKKAALMRLRDLAHSVQQRTGDDPNLTTDLEHCRSKYRQVSSMMGWKPIIEHVGPSSPGTAVATASDANTSLDF
eukprot:Clim_evm19s9 gene=Clim_evmTU19s9